MVTKAWSNEYRATTVCVDSYENGTITGRLYNPYLESGRSFSNLMQFLLEMEQTLDTMAFPQSFTAARSFVPTLRKAPGLPESDILTGETATFAVKVIFRQNASWQGSVIWLEGGREQSFRSALELVFLMENALTQADEQVS